MKRPNKRDLTKEEINTIATVTYNSNIEKYDESSITIESIAKAIDRLGSHSNGYEYAKYLEDEGATYIDSIIIEALVIIYYDIDTKVKENIRQWVIDNSIKPKLKIGDKVEGFHESGVIDGIDLENAIYYVTINGNKNRRSLVPFENIEK